MPVSEDAAWVAIPSAWPVERLAELCADLEMILRINPCYVFRSWRQTSADRFHAEIENLSNQQQLTLDIERTPGPKHGFTLAYRQGLKRRTEFALAPRNSGSLLTITDDYSGTPAEERQARLTEVDKSLPVWGEALRVYFARVRRWSWLPGWRWYMRRFWAPMKPSARRIVWLLYLISVAEFFFFLFVILIWWVEYR